MKKKITIFNLILIAVALCVVLVAGISVNRSSHYSEAEQQVVTLTDVYVANFAKLTSDKCIDVDVPDGVRLTLVDVGGKVLFDSDKNDIEENHSGRAEIAAAFSGKPQVEVRYSDTLHKDMIYYARTVTTTDNQTVCVRVAVAVDTVEEYVTQTVPTLVWVLFAALLVSFGVSMFFGNELTKPVRDVKDMLVAVNNGNYTKINARYGDAEMDKLVDEINNVSETLQANITSVKQAEKTRSEFFANASHELKTPLTAIKGFNDIVGMTSDQDSVKQLSQKIDRETARLTALINDMLALSRLEVSAEPVNERTDFVAVCTEVCEDLKPLADKRNVTLAVHGQGTGVVGADHLRTIVKNLVENAVRYNRDGGSVDVSVKQQDGKTVLSVADTGVGIAEEHQAHVFERFYRVNASRSRETGGTGLGLAIVKHIASLYGAQVQLTSRLGVGTTVTIIFD